MGLTDAPAHVWSSIALVGYLAVLVVVSIVGMALGYPEALWVWLLPLLTGFESEDCHCDDCEPPKESSNEVLARRYAKGELSDEEMEAVAETLEAVQTADEPLLEDTR